MNGHRIKKKEVNISNNKIPKTTKIGDYWSEQYTMEINNLLKEYQGVLTWDYEYLKGLVQKMGEMNIDILLDAKPAKKRLY